MDTKKKEMLGNFYRAGVTDAAEPTIVNDHDFPSASNGTVIPGGIYDMEKMKRASISTAAETRRNWPAIASSCGLTSKVITTTLKQTNY